MSDDVEGDDDDEYLPDIGEAQYLIDQLLALNPRERLRGKKGNALRELVSFRERIKEWPAISPDERRSFVNRWWVLNSGEVDGASRHEILGPGRFSWREKGRPTGSYIGQFPGDDEMIREALALKEARNLALGSALRQVIKAKARGGFEIESVIKRLRRKIEGRPP